MVLSPRVWTRSRTALAFTKEPVFLKKTGSYAPGTADGAVAAPMPLRYLAITVVSLALAVAGRKRELTGRPTSEQFGPLCHSEATPAPIGAQDHHTLRQWYPLYTSEKPTDSYSRLAGTISPVPTVTSVAPSALSRCIPSHIRARASPLRR